MDNIRVIPKMNVEDFKNIFVHANDIIIWSTKNITDFADAYKNHHINTIPSINGVEFKSFCKKNKYNSDYYSKNLFIHFLNILEYGKYDPMGSKDYIFSDSSVKNSNIELYCYNCGENKLKYIEQYANGEEWECTSCNEKFIN